MPPSHLDRRSFMGASVGAAAVGLSAQVARPADGAAAADDVPRPPMVALGATGIKTTRLAQGTGVTGGKRQSNQTRMGFEKLTDLFHHAYDRGLRFFDLADLYGTHYYFREALRQIPPRLVTLGKRLLVRTTVLLPLQHPPMSIAFTDGARSAFKVQRSASSTAMITGWIQRLPVVGLSFGSPGMNDA